MPIQRIEPVALPFAGRRHTPDTARMQALYLRLGEDLAALGMRKGAITAQGLERLGALFSNYSGTKREQAALAAAAGLRQREKDEERAFIRERDAAERTERARERQDARADAQRAEDRAAARWAVDNTEAGPVDPSLAAWAERFPELAGRFRRTKTLPATVTPGAAGEVSAEPTEMAVLEPSATQMERRRERAAEQAARDAAVKRQERLDRETAEDRRADNARADEQLRISRMNAETTRMNADTTRARFTGGGVDTVKLGPFANVLDRAVLTITPAKRGPILNLAHRLADEGNIEELKGVIKQAAIENENVDAKNQIRGRMATVAALEDARVVLAEMKKAGVPTNILTGTAEDIARRLGTSTDPRYVAFANQLEDALINYRRAATGVAFSERESAQYARMFPNYRQTLPVNEAAINGIIRAMETNDRTYWENKLGKEGAALVLGPKRAVTVAPVDRIDELIKQYGRQP